jgi:F-type H+-transporting ATPase subunit epsilon
MHLKIITHEKVVFDEDVNEIYTRGVHGEFGVLKGHIPIMSALDIGITKVVQDDGEHLFTTMGGVFQYKDGEAIILTETAEAGDEIDEFRARQALERAKQRLNEHKAGLDVKRAQAAIARAMVRLKISLKE